MISDCDGVGRPSGGAMSLVDGLPAVLHSGGQRCITDGGHRVKHPVRHQSSISLCCNPSRTDPV